MLKTILTSVWCLSLLACTKGYLAQELQGEGPTTLDLYRGVTDAQISEPQRATLRQQLDATLRYEGYSRDAGNEIDQLFARLPNPRIVIYIYPHLSTRDHAPVPGYTTAINLYAKDEYALPHEVTGFAALPEAR